MNEARSLRFDSRYTTHARTMEELRTEFLSDIHRRIALIETRTKALLGKNAREASRLASIRLELENMADYWNEVELVHDRKREAK